MSWVHERGGVERVGATTAGIHPGNLPCAEGFPVMGHPPIEPYLLES